MINCKYIENFTIYNYRDSATEYYEGSSIKFVALDGGKIKGDINGDPKVDIKYYAIIKWYVVRKKEFNMAEKSADINNDEYINIFDFIRFKKII